MNIKIIGVLGIKRSGKDTTADFLVQHHGFQRYAFADPIKRAAIELFGFTEAQMWGSQEDKETVDTRWNISPRRMLQLMGTELFQYDIHKHLTEEEFNWGRAVWVRKFELWFNEQEELYREANQDLLVVLSDVRFHHESDVIKKMGGQIWRIERPSLLNNDLHASEIEMQSIVANETFVNDGTIEELYAKINAKLEQENATA